jgi:alanine dehydrogenase
VRVGVPREVKDQEYRVGLTPAGVHALVEAGHEVLIERGAGEGSGIPDEEYSAAGAMLGESAAELWHAAEMVVKVKEPIASEYGHIRPGQTLFTYLHLAPLPELTDVLLRKEVTGIAYETVTGRNRRALAALSSRAFQACRRATS